MRHIASIVEGHGDAFALPTVLRRILVDLNRSDVIRPLRPIRVPRTRLLRSGELERTIELAARQTSPSDGILVLIDADEDCAGALGPQLLERAHTARPDRKVSVVLAVREFEAWFIAAISSLAGTRGLPDGLIAPPNAEAIADPKAWINRQLPAHRSYRETVDQPAFASVFDINAARAAASFDKLFRTVVSFVE